MSSKNGNGRNKFEDIIEIFSVPSPTGEFENTMKLVEANDGTLMVQVATCKNGKPIARPVTFNLLDLLVIREAVSEGCELVNLGKKEKE